HSTRFRRRRALSACHSVQSELAREAYDWNNSTHFAVKILKKTRFFKLRSDSIDLRMFDQSVGSIIVGLVTLISRMTGSFSLAGAWSVSTKFTLCSVSLSIAVCWIRKLVSFRLS